MVRPQNTILADIVVANSGTVTDPNNRNSLLQDWLNALTSEEQRYFAELDSVLNSRLVYANTLVFGAGDSFQFDVTKYTGTAPLFSGGSNNRCYSHSNGDIELVSGNTSVWSGATSLVDAGSMYSFRVEFSATTVELFIAGVSKGAQPFSGVFNLLTLAKHGSSSFYNGILANAVATISGVTTTNPIGLATGNVEQSSEGNNSLTYVNIPEANREQFQLSGDTTQWDNISPLPQELPAVIEIA